MFCNLVLVKKKNIKIIQNYEHVVVKGDISLHLTSTGEWPHEYGSECRCSPPHFIFCYCFRNASISTTPLISPI